jgi:hypothetical protein
MFCQLFCKLQESLKRARETAADNPVYKKMKVELENMGKDNDAQQDDNNQQDNTPDQQGKQRNKRQLLKAFKSYTVRKGKEGRFKGWSTRACDDMTEHVITLTREECKVQYDRFRAGYRQVYLSRIQAKKNSSPGEGQPVVKPRYKVVWGIPDIPLEEI